MENIIACRPGCYDLPASEAFGRLKEAGIDNVEASVPEDDDYGRLYATAAEIGVSISSLATGCKLDRPEEVARLERVIEGAAQIGTRIIFVSVSLNDARHEQGIPVLTNLARKAEAAGVVLSFETHEPYGQNADTALRTLETVDSRGLGYNFDTANIYYYNPEGIDTVAELKKVVQYVASVHIKDSARGEPRSDDFPVLGEGIVDFPEVFRILGERGFNGPYTLELEGPAVHGLPVEERSGKVRACLAYLRKIGVTR